MTVHDRAMSAGLSSTTPLSLNREETNGHDSFDDNGARANRIRVKNRRRRWLELHPEYFTDDSREISDPLLYDRLVRRFMTAEERESQGQNRGFAATLEANITRSEAKLEALEHPDPGDPLSYVRASDGSISTVEQDVGARPRDKEDALTRWRDHIADRFMRGDDPDMDYKTIDDNEDFDDRAEEERGRLEKYMSEESERFVGEGTPQGETGVQDF